MAQHVLKSGPDRNGKAKLEQLLMLHELHGTYKNKDTKKCILLMYLKLIRRENLDLDTIEQLENFRVRKIDEPLKITRHLAKLPAIFKVLV